MKITNNPALKNIIDLTYRKKLPNLFQNINNQNKINQLLSFLQTFSGKIIFYLTRKESLKKILKFLMENKIYPKYIEKIIDINKKFNYFYMIGTIQNGFIDPKNNLLFLCTKDLLPIIFQKESLLKIKNDTTFKKSNLSELFLNDPIIHIEHGIGRYKGLTTIKTASIKSEYLIISYAEGDKLYLPVSCLHLVAPYTKTSIKDAPLHKLGGEEWNKEKCKIRKTLYDHAARLLNIYANRASQKGFLFKKNEEIYQIFCKDCLFKITKDQDKVMKSVLKDMCTSIPMDRLICGDVGFGKTEIAMRAAFLSVSNKKQVAVLVPTTLLAQQHYDNFKKRFSNWSFNIDILSRFQNKKKQNLLLKNIANGNIHIIIGTHKLLLKEIEWNSLGLLIIDEEHRFGVNHKEIIQTKHANVDVLTLTATPIPRTLNMSMTGIKDVSIIAKPPAQRLAIKTYIQEYNPLLVRKTILREISRGGQVYYIYNKVQNILNIAERLSKLIPEANIKIGHGQMSNIDLKKVMNEFYHNKFNVLICTTIIESGIDIPRANTIIIENSDHFGLSQLHQLRGRIGRSSSQAYALFLVNNFNTITVDAKKRLEAISSVNNFGGGFSLSNQDLEIRGIGKLLGKEQSGHMENIGFSLYMKLLKNAIHILKNGKNTSINQLLEKPLEIELHVSSLLPDNYIIDVNKRLFFYKKISQAIDEKKIEKIKNELIDQFGPLPLVAENLIIIAKIRLIADQIGIKSIQANQKIGVIHFNKNNSVNTQYILQMFEKEPNTWKIESATKLKFIWNLNDDYSRLKWIKNILKNLINHNE
ncbi:transcription-repair coupling factor [Buchnera aphidicola]|uniref:Transcription-repair-coupling factor n=1 Tax=Buchnera aphidicola str. USDA (Myzus persicae) TaxID=1009856 RepID=W0P4U4_BUCMP|nr:transcription-repair coupling factor [Buchnera aphidicola]AHG60088.1 Mfd [Buchnera aphidicola str. USDA (Myzus persicae)]AHG60668.1 Mfd [Buchnera aphidicola str. W106 (Myzus persicae)]AHG61240.1 Mfd [Buchnera aphidicola str. G002 (Myzus persicae)]AHG61813.1 Mfd [Buchnera aphidicola str. F009 (Myzus persicae)]WAI03223.1 MAG: transcription-repair coupling factor [Buchnera aphidicola (Myzus persicae)]